MVAAKWLCQIVGAVEEWWCVNAFMIQRTLLTCKSHFACSRNLSSWALAYSTSRPMVSDPSAISTAANASSATRLGQISTMPKSLSITSRRARLA